MSSTLRHISVLGLDLLLLAIGLGHLPAVFERARAPFEATTVNDTVRVSRILETSAAGGLRPGDAIIRFGESDVHHHDDLEALGDLRAIGEQMPVESFREGRADWPDVRLVAYYTSPRFTIVMTLVALITWIMAVVVAWQRLETPGARALHWALVLLATCLLMTQGRVDPSEASSIVGRVLLLGSYMLSGAFFTLFVFVYPRPHFRSTRWTAAAVLTPGLLCALIVSGCYARMVLLRDAASIAVFNDAYDGFHLLLACYIAVMFVELISAYRRATSHEDRIRLQWILWGLIAAPAPFVLAIILPDVVLGRDLLPEDAASAFLLIAPFALSVSLLRHQLFDIELLINRSIVYLFLTLFVGIVYALAIIFLVSLVGSPIAFGEFITIVLVSLSLAFLLNPMRRRLQRVVDTTLFPVRTDARRALAAFSGELRGALTPKDLGRVFVERTMSLLPFRAAAIYFPEGEWLHPAWRSGGGLPDVVPLSTVVQMTGSGSAALPGKRSLRIRPPERRDDLAARLGCSVAVPLRSDEGMLLGLFVGVCRNPGAALADDEGEYLWNMALTSCEVLERLELQRSVLIEHQERQRMEELNAMKSAFVSSVSHELRTPLTSIRMFAEMLRSRARISRKTEASYLEIIDHEAERLSRLIDNVLDFSRIERGVKEYRFGPCDMREVVRRAAAAMAYPFRINKGTLRVRCPAKLPLIEGDADALEAAVINLLSNGLKYSTTTRRVELTVRRERAGFAIIISDQGIGIAAEEVPKIFDQFYRVRDGRASQIGGMGLGLSLVRHVVEAHHGEIDVRSVLGKGSTFTILLPYSTSVRRNT